MRRVVDSVVGVAKESAKTFSREAFNNIINFVNGLATLVLALVPGKARLTEGLQGWELRPTFRAPQLPRWMEEGVSSLNNFIYEFADSDSGSDSEPESTAESDYLTDDVSLPSSPSSASSYRTSTAFHHHQERRHGLWNFVRKFCLLICWPITLWLRRRRGMTNLHRRNSSSSTPSAARFRELARSGSSTRRGKSRGLLQSRSSSSSSLSQHLSIASTELSRKWNDVVEYVTHLNDNRRRGIIEDLQLVMELAIERVFEAVRGVLHYAVSPWQSLKVIGGGVQNALERVTGLRWRAPVADQARPTDATGPSGAQVREGPSGGIFKLQLQHTLATDARSVEDIVTDAGYPYEAMKVTTEDGYVLKLERIPRPNSSNVVLMQHGLADSSLGWVSNGVVGSQAFAAYDLGFDVFLGNLRGYATREHVDSKISAQRFWRYSVNEHGMCDLVAMVDKIHVLKTAKLRSADAGEPSPAKASSSANGNVDDSEGEGAVARGKSNTHGPESDKKQLYKLQIVAHSLGGAAAMVYVVTQRLKQQPHRLSRLILLSPAGFNEKTPLLFDILLFLVPFIDPLMTRYLPGLYIPTRGLRLLFNKLAQDFQNLPALRALVQVTMSSLLVGGDASDWVGALLMPHYNMYNMPGVAYRVLKHLSQMKASRRFQLYDYGSTAANCQVYGTPQPLDIGAHYGLVDIPVDVVMGRRDRLIPPEMVMRHYQALRANDCTASIKEFEYAHLDFTFAHKQELLAYVMARLVLPSGKDEPLTASSSCMEMPGSNELADFGRPQVGPGDSNDREMGSHGLSKKSAVGGRGGGGNRRRGMLAQRNGQSAASNGTDRASLALNRHMANGHNNSKEQTQARSGFPDSCSTFLQDSVALATSNGNLKEVSSFKSNGGALLDQSISGKRENR